MDGWMQMGSVDDNSSGGYYGYRMSKSAMNICAKSLSIDLKRYGIAVCLLHPGYVQTQMTGYNGNIKPETSAKGLEAQIDALDMTNTGTWWNYRGEVLPW